MDDRRSNRKGEGKTLPAGGGKLDESMASQPPPIKPRNVSIIRRF